MRLKEISNIRTGDKGNLINISVVAHDLESFDLIKNKLTEESVKDFYNEFSEGLVTRYQVDNLKAFNFVLEDFLDGGVTRNLLLDRHGKSMGMALGEIEL